MTKQIVVVHDNEIVVLGPVTEAKVPPDVKHYLQLRTANRTEEVWLTDDQARQIAHYLLSRIGEPTHTDPLGV